MQPMDTPTPPMVILAEEPAARPSCPSSSRSTAQDHEPPADHPLDDAATSNSDNSENVDLTVTDTVIRAEAHSHQQELQEYSDSEEQQRESQEYSDSEEGLRELQEYSDSEEYSEEAQCLGADTDDEDAMRILYGEIPWPARKLDRSGREVEPWFGRGWNPYRNLGT